MTTGAGRPGRSVLVQEGPWPFITRRVTWREGQIVSLWRSRHHRKGLPVKGAAHTLALEMALSRCLWMPRELNWWIGVLFALGSVLFGLGSWLSLQPLLAHRWHLSPEAVSTVFLLGSFPFTAAAYLQLFQAANSPLVADQPQRRRSHWRWFGWRPGDLGWLSCALQFPGTLLFNLNTYNALNTGLDWFDQDLAIWTPNILGSVLFMASGYLSFMETCHSPWAWQPRSLSWWVTSTNLLGCVGFLLSALVSVVLPSTVGPAFPTVSLIFTLMGAMGFLIGSLLMLPESVVPS
jgi:hypothetical protein